MPTTINILKNHTTVKEGPILCFWWCVYVTPNVYIGVVTMDKYFLLKSCPDNAKLLYVLVKLLPSSPVQKCNNLPQLQSHLYIRIDIKNPIPGHISREDYNLERYMHPNIHSITIYSSQDTETIKTSLNRGMDTGDVVSTYNAILLRCKKNEILPLATTQMDQEMVTLREPNSKDKYVMSLACGVSNVIQVNLFTKQKQTYRLESKHGHLRESGGGINKDLQ